MRINTAKYWVFVAIIAAAHQPAQAAAVSDAIGDYVVGYNGSTVGDLDVVSASVSYDPTTAIFRLDSTFNAAIGSSPGGFYVWGFNRGSGTARFEANGLNNILFDSVVRLNNDGTGVVTLIAPAFSTTDIAPGSVTITGNHMVAEIAAGMLPSAGFAPESFTWNLWPRDGAVTAGFTQISDFAPDTFNVGVQVVPLPSAAWLFGSMLGWLGLVRNRRAAGG